MAFRIVILFSALVLLVNTIAPMDLACAFEMPNTELSSQTSVESEHGEESDDCCDDEDKCNLCSFCHPSLALIQDFSAETNQTISQYFSDINPYIALFQPDGPEEPPRRTFIS